MENFEKVFEAMIGQFLNINLYGPSGCGKTCLLNKIVSDEFKNSYVYIKYNLSDFYSKKNIFELFRKNINKFLQKISKGNTAPLDNINKWYDFYQSLETFKNTKIKIYFIIDSILDMDSFNYYKKEIIKLFVALKSCQSAKIILISNFDITNSEIQSDYDFSSIIPIQFPPITQSALKGILEKVLSGKYYDSNSFEELVNTCIQNFQYNFLNINEFIFNINQNLHIFNNLTTDGKMNEFYRNAKYIHGSDKKKKDKKDKEKEKEKERDKTKSKDKDKDVEMRDERDKKKYENENDDINIEKEKENEDKNREHSKHHSDHKKYENDIHTSNFYAITNGLDFNPKNVRMIIKNQSRCAPIHEIKLETFFKKQDINQAKKEKEKEEKKEDKANNPTKNLTESLSTSQKFLLLASFMASEISPKNDKMLFKAKKTKGPKRNNRKNNNNTLGHNLKSTIGYPFNIHRLTAIYQSLLSSNHLNFEDDDLMVKCEITTLEKLGLIRNLSGIDARTIDQKYITRINLDLARKIAEDFDIKLEDYIKVDSLD